MATFGEISWDEVASNSNGNKSGKDSWLRLKDGDNEIRLLTKPYQMQIHKIKKDVTDAKDYGQKVNCSKFHGSCPACDLAETRNNPGDKCKSRWLFGVIDRSTGTSKILDVSYGVMVSLKKYASNTKSWGDPTKYDINIVVDKKAPPTSYYSVQALPKEPLSAADQKLRDEVDIDELNRLITPPSPEAVQKRLDKIFEGTAPAAAVAAAVSKKSKVEKVEKVVEEDDAEFPDYEQK